MSPRFQRLLSTVTAALAMLAVAGCSSPSSEARQREAFLAGQEQAFQMLQHNGIAVVRFVGPFKRQVLLWREGLTITQAIVDGGYTAPAAPRHIVVRNGLQTTPIDPQSLLNGEDVRVNPGDILEVLP